MTLDDDRQRLHLQLSRMAQFPQAIIGGYDGTTQHNVPASLPDFRKTAGVLTIGLAISEPFWSTSRSRGVTKRC